MAIIALTIHDINQYLTEKMLETKQSEIGTEAENDDLSANTLGIELKNFLLLNLKSVMSIENKWKAIKEGVSILDHGRFLFTLPPFLQYLSSKDLTHSQKAVAEILQSQYGCKRRRLSNNFQRQHMRFWEVNKETLLTRV